MDSITSQHLPDDVWGVVFRNLHVKELLQITTVCRQWNHASSIDRIWNRDGEPSLTKKGVKILYCEKLPQLLEKVEKPTKHRGIGFAPQTIEESTWVSYGCNENIDGFTMPNVISSVKEYENLLSIYGRVFHIALRCARIGLTSLYKVEKIAFDSAKFAKNPTPFKILELEYEKCGDKGKMTMMRLLKENQKQEGVTITNRATAQMRLRKYQDEE